jgi:membrane protease YdiL (CAAX protease family)
MLTNELSTAPSPSPPRLAIVFAILFTAYQLPEGLGMRVLHSFPVQAVLMLSFLPIAWLCGRWLGLRGLDAWYMGLSPGWRRLLVGAFALSVAAKAAALAVGAGLGVYAIAALAQPPIVGIVVAALVMLASTFFPSIAEDIVTRGFLMRALPALSRRWLFVPVSAALYVLNHIYQLLDGPLELLRLFCFGLAYAAALYYSRSLWPAIGLHWGWNFAGQFADKLVASEVLAPSHGPLLSAAAHLAMLGVVVVVAHTRPLASTPRLQN